MGVFVIAEAGSSHDNDLQKAYRLIEAAKECGADAVKFQWTSDPFKMAKRRGVPKVEETGHMYESYLAKPERWLHDLKAHADKVGIGFGCTVYLIEDIPVIAPLVAFFKVSAFEAKWPDFINAHPNDRTIIISLNTGTVRFGLPLHSKQLYCVSEYPTPLEHLRLGNLHDSFDGLSDHTANVLTGAAAVAAGAEIIEAHIRLYDTDKSNPDYGHSLVANVYEDDQEVTHHKPPFAEYVSNIRTVERML